MRISFRRLGNTPPPVRPMYLSNPKDYLLWFAKNRTAMKFRRLHVPRRFSLDAPGPWQFVETNNERVSLSAFLDSGSDMSGDGIRFVQRTQSSWPSRRSWVHSGRRRSFDPSEPIGIRVQSLSTASHQARISRAVRKEHEVWIWRRACSGVFLGRWLSPKMGAPGG